MVRTLPPREQGTEIAVEATEELMHVDEIVGGHDRERGGRFERVSSVPEDAGDVVPRELGPAEILERFLGLTWVAVVEDGGHERSGVTLVALDDHRPHGGLSRHDMDIVWDEGVMADPTTPHSIDDLLLDLAIRNRILHESRLTPDVWPRGLDDGRRR
ncbi:MAG: hypothetical protein WKF80_01235 [Thermomicrobiales bacterium]